MQFLGFRPYTVGSKLDFHINWSVIDSVLSNRVACDAKNIVVHHARQRLDLRQ